VGGASLIDEPLSTRRRWLEKLVREHAHPCLQLMEQTVSCDIAREWLTLLPAIEVGRRNGRIAGTTPDGGATGSRSSGIARLIAPSLASRVI
jgi:hypothetical protein